MPLSAWELTHWYGYSIVRREEAEMERRKIEAQTRRR